MTSRWTTKLALAASSTLISGLGVAWYLSQRATSPVAMTWMDPLPATASAAPARPSGYRARPLSAEERERIVASNGLHDQDELCYHRYRANADYTFSWPEHPLGRIHGSTNSLGLRGSREVRADRPELRILVTGDSHTDGVCDPEETYTAEIERRLAAQGRDVEALNAGVGGYTFHHYVGAVERFLPLAPDVVVVGVYGGNDFYEALAFQHLFAGTTMPAAGAELREQFVRANDVSTGAVAQSMMALRYFAEFPDQAEVALAAARLASDEIADLCERNGARLVFVYIPPAVDVAPRAHGELLLRTARAIGLADSDLTRIDEIAERYLAYLRDEGFEVVDLRPRFLAQESPPYWKRDFHIDLAGQQIVAGEVAPRIAALCPPGYERHSRVPDVAAVGRVREAPTLGRAWVLEVEDLPLSLPQLDEPRVRALFALPEHARYDEQALFVLDSAAVPGVDGDGLWLAGGPPAPASGRRVLLAADELVYGPGDTGPRVGELLAARASLECLDATTPGAGPLHYLGLVDKHAARGLDHVVVVWNGANDFLEALELRRALSERPRAGATDEGPDGSARERDPDRKRGPIAPRGPGEVVGRLEPRPRDARHAVEAAVQFVFELRRRTSASGTRLVIAVARPNAGLARSKVFGRLDVLDQMATLFAGTLRREGIECLDPDGSLEAEIEPVLDASGARLTPLARERLADAIAAALATTR